eukprot:1709402-Alexandrium_andersonii.AAC.1
MESVYFEACRLLDVPAYKWQLLTRDGTGLDKYIPVLEAYCRYRRPLLLAAATPTVTRGRHTQPKQE